jgi:oligopeptide transport system permease protein
MSDPTPEAELILAGDPDAAVLLEPFDQDGEVKRPRTLAGDAWYDLRHRWIFWISAFLLLLVMLMVLFPNVIADADKTSSLTGGCSLSESLQPPSATYWFGTDQQGCDVYSLSVFGLGPVWRWASSQPS